MKKILILAMISSVCFYSSAHAKPVAIICEVAGSKSTIVFDDATQTVTQNDVPTFDARIGPRAISYSLMSPQTGTRFDVHINRDTKQIILTAWQPRQGKRVGEPVRMQGQCGLATQRAF